MFFLPCLTRKELLLPYCDIKSGPIEKDGSTVPWMQQWVLMDKRWTGYMSMDTLPETNIAMENGPFEDVFPIEHGDIPASYVSLPVGMFSTFPAINEPWCNNWRISIPKMAVVKKNNPLLWACCNTLSLGWLVDQKDLVLTEFFTWWSKFTPLKFNIETQKMAIVERKFHKFQPINSPKPCKNQGFQPSKYGWNNPGGFPG